MTRLDEISNVHWHLLDLSAVELLDFSHHADILSGDEVNRNTLSAKTTTTTNSVDIVLTVGGKIIVDDQGDLLDIDTTGQKISGDQDTGRTRSEFLHNQITLTLVHVTVHSGNGEITGSELVGEPVDLSSGVAEYNCLCDGNGLVQVGKGVQLPVLLLDGNVELLDTFEGEFGLLDQDTDRVAHELGGNLKNVLWHGCGEENDLGRLGEELEDIIDLLGETTLRKLSVSLAEKKLQRVTYGKHFIGLIKNEHLHAVGLQESSLNHVLDTTRGTDDNLGTLLKSLHVITNAGTTNAGMALDVHEVTDGDNDFLDLLSQFTGGSKDQSLALLDVWVKLLEDGNGESSGLSGSRLGLSDNIMAFGESAIVGVIF